MIECNRRGRGVQSDRDRLPMLGVTIGFRNQWQYLFGFMCKSDLILDVDRNEGQRYCLRLYHLEGKQTSC